MDTKFEIMHPFYIETASHSNKFSMNIFHYHLEYELYFLEDGDRNLLIGDKLKTIKKNDVALIKSNVIHHTSGGACTRTIVYISKNYLKRFFTDKTINKLLSCFSKEAISLSAEDFAACKKMLNKMQAEFSENPKDNNSFITLANLLLLLGDASKDISSVSETDGKNLLTDILSYINKNYQTIRSLDDISSKFFITKFHLCRIFKEKTGATINTYINRLRLKKACELLQTTDLNAVSIAENCGFNSPIYFSQSFKKAFGISPIVYRKEKKFLYDINSD